MDRQTVSLIIDDSAPVVSLHWALSPGHRGSNGVALQPRIPLEFLNAFCDVAEEYGLAGKFSVIPMAGGLGSVLTGFDGAAKAEVDEWLETVKRRLSPRFSFCPEILTHAQAVDLETGALLPLREDEWAKTQTWETLTPYLARGLDLLRQVGIRAVGVTSPWMFGIEVEDDYARAVSEAVWQVHGEKEAWYFCRIRRDEPGAGPWVAYRSGDRRTVSIPATTSDCFWDARDLAPGEGGEEMASALADRQITEDGTSGAVIHALEIGAMPVMLTHWQSLFGNGTWTGLKALAIAARRINRNLKDRVVWRSYEEIMRATP